MIFATLLCKIIWFFCAAAAVVYSVRASMTVRKKIVVFASLIICALGANYLASFVPDLTDAVALTACNEKNDHAKDCEIFIEGFKIDGKNVW